MNNFSEHFTKKSEQVLEKTINHPFNVELAKGSLDIEIFRRYLAQDNLYLQAYSRALLMLASRAPGNDEMQFWFTLANDGIEMEQELQTRLFDQFSVQPAETPLPWCKAYEDHIMNATAYKPYPVATAALLPCFVNYLEQGLSMDQIRESDNLYDDWLNTYVSDEYIAVTRKFAKYLESLYSKADESMKYSMDEIYYQSTFLEYKFIDAIYCNKSWKI